MKTVHLPFLLSPKLRQSIEQVLGVEESLSSFIEQAIREHIKLRQKHQVYLTRSLASCEIAFKNGEYHNAEDILRELDKLLVTDEPRY